MIIDALAKTVRQFGRRCAQTPLRGFLDGCLWKSTTWRSSPVTAQT